MVNIEEFDKEVSCVFKQDNYLVRDNGAIMRLSREGKPKRPQDNKWTFGTYSSAKDGYLYFCGIGIHRIIATAFHGEAPSPQHVVDHIDTNRQNNRPENLRWLTKLENILNNEITRKKVEFVCGSIEEFLKDPSLLFGREDLDKNFKWMRAVSKKEAEISLNNIKEWLKNGSSKERKSLFHGNGDWIFEEKIPFRNVDSCPEEPTHQEPTLKQKPSLLPGEITWEELRASIPAQTEPKPDKSVLVIDEKNDESVPEIHRYKDSLTKGAVQNISWSTPTEFPQCPLNTKGGLDSYLVKLKPGSTLTSNRYCKSKVIKAVKGIHSDIIVVCEMVDSVKPLGITTIHIENDSFAHDAYGTYFDPKGAEKYFTILQGKEWTGGEVMDDYC